MILIIQPAGFRVCLDQFEDCAPQFGLWESTADTTCLFLPSCFLVHNLLIVFLPLIWHGGGGKLSAAAAGDAASSAAVAGDAAASAAAGDDCFCRFFGVFFFAMVNSVEAQ